MLKNIQKDWIVRLDKHIKYNNFQVDTTSGNASEATQNPNTTQDTSQSRQNDTVQPGNTTEASPDRSSEVIDSGRTAQPVSDSVSREDTIDIDKEQQAIPGTDTTNISIQDTLTEQEGPDTLPEQPVSDTIPVSQDTVKRDTTVSQPAPATPTKKAPAESPVYREPTIKESADIPYLLSNEGIASLHQENFDQILLQKMKITPFLKSHATVFKNDNEKTNDGKAYQTYLKKEKNQYKDQLPSFFTGGSVSLILIISFILLLISKLVYPKYFQNLVISVYNYSLSTKLLRDKNVRLTRLSFFLNSLFSINLSLFITYALYHSQLNIFKDNLAGSFFLYFGCIVLLYALKSFTCRIIGYVFRKEKPCKEYIHSFYLMNKNMGLFLFPLLLTIPFISSEFSSYVINIGLGIIGYFFLFRYVRGLQIIFQYNLSLFYMFLYFCTMELAPLFLIYKGFLYFTNL